MIILLRFLMHQLSRQRRDIRCSCSAGQLLRFLCTLGDLPTFAPGSCPGDPALTAVFTGDDLRNTPPFGRFFNRNILQKTSSFLFVNREFLRNTFEIRETLSQEFDTKHDRHNAHNVIIGIIFN